MGTLQLLPIFPTTKDKFEIQTEQGILLATDISFAPVRTIPTIDRAKDSYSFVGTITFINTFNHRIVSPYA